MLASATLAATLAETLAATLAAAPARAQAWPSRPITILVGFAPGGGTDIIARALQPAMAEDLGQPIAIDTLPTYLGHIRAGRVRALATTMPTRTEWLPDVPSVAESGFPGFNADV